MRKMKIINRTKLSDLECLEYIRMVMEMGQLSKTAKGRQYCFVTTFKSGYVVNVHLAKTMEVFTIEKSYRDLLV